MWLEPRENISIILILLSPLLAVLAAMTVSSVLVFWSGAPIFKAFWLLFEGGLGSRFAISETLTRTTPLLFTGLSTAVAFRAKLWNIGGEGQLYFGACAATLLGTSGLSLHPALMVPILLLAGAMAGGLLLLVPTLLKTKMKVDEVVTTLLLNFIVLLFVNYLVFGPWKDPQAMGWPQSPLITEAGFLPKLLSRTRLHAGFFIAFGCAFGTWALLRYTIWGYEIRAVGANIKASTFAGCPVNMVLVRTALISGGLAGVAGASELCGVKGYLTLDLSPEFGYAGIVVAMLAGLHPLAVILTAFFVAMVYVGADSMSRTLSISKYFADVMTAVSLLSVLASVMLIRYRIRWR